MDNKTIEQIKEQQMIDAIEFAKQSREHLESILVTETDAELREVLARSIKDLEYIRYTLRKAKTQYTAYAEEAEYSAEGLGNDDQLTRMRAEKRAKVLLEKIEAEVRS